MADLAYAVLVIGVFGVLALMLRGMERLWTGPVWWRTSLVAASPCCCSSTCSSPWSSRRSS